MKTGRRTVAVATLVGALGLSVLNAPTAQAADTGITVSDIVINNGKPIVVGTTNVVEPPIGFDIALPSGYSTSNPSRYDAYPFLYRGSIKTAADTGENFIQPGSYTCYETDSKHTHCEGDLYIDPHPSQEHVDSNSDASAVQCEGLRPARREHAPDAAGPALWANDGTSRTRPGLGTTLFAWAGPPVPMPQPYQESPS